MASMSRVRLPEEQVSAKTRTLPGKVTLLSRAASDSSVTMGATILPPSLSATQLPPFDEFAEPQGEREYLQGVVARMEALQSQQRSPQQPNPEIDSMISKLLAGHPERRHQMAVMTKSALLRKKILTSLAAGGRALGSAVLGNTYYYREKALPDSFSDCNWPKASHNEHGIHHLPGGADHHDRLLRCPNDKRTYHPTLESTPFYSVPSTKRFPGTHHNGEINKDEVQNRSSPGPGAYFKTVPRGTSFSVDGGETVVCGANHTCPWKKLMGRQINPVDVDLASLTSAPCWSFPKTRRTVSDTVAGHGLQDGGPVKSDTGCLSPGHVYELHSTMRPMYGTRTLDGSQSCVRRKIRERLGAGGKPKTKVRCVPVPPEAPKESEEMQ
eukprot:TRINITY_DN52018_c0_g1_i1.p1 TRINITY_DN52018_c0_g1~~TRINITY_DN52018_c0_g1_i1.p1  ORF type:complete len:395 (-),score=51.77 TRINITY_DN52018_c0_g1_i1:17-1165(-)